MAYLKLDTPQVHSWYTLSALNIPLSTNDSPPNRSRYISKALVVPTNALNDLLMKHIQLPPALIASSALHSLQYTAPLLQLFYQRTEHPNALMTAPPPSHPTALKTSDGLDNYKALHTHY